MHPYSIDINDRARVYPIMVILSILSGYYLNVCILSKIDFYNQFSWLFDAPSSVAFIGIYYVVFDKWLWRILSKYNLGIRTPVLKGKYEGILKSSKDNMSADIPIKITVKQTWSRIKIYLTTDTSSSESEMASICTEVAHGCKLTYQFINRVRIAHPAMHIHTGLTCFDYNPDTKELKGTYFTDWHRKNYGEISVKFINQ